MILNHTATNDYFFQLGRRASCRYILVGPQDWESEAQAFQSFFVRHKAELEMYRDHHGWSITVPEILQHVHAVTRQESAGPALQVDIPHYLVDAQRGLLCIDAAFRKNQNWESRLLPPELKPEAEAFRVHSLPLTDYPQSATQTITQSFLADLTPMLRDGIRLVQNLEDQNPREPGLGNCFATVDWEQEQLSKLTGSSKLLWKRFLDRTASLLRNPARGEPQLPERERPLFTSVGQIPSNALPLSNLSGLVDRLFMFPSHIPQTSFTMTLYSYGSRLYFILSGKTENDEQKAITQRLLNTGWVLEATGE